MSIIAVDQITDSNGGNTAIVNGATPTIYNTMGRNRIINGDMQIDQRNSGSVWPKDTAYTVDRWQYQNSYADNVTVQQNLNSIAPPPGYNNYLGIQVNSAYTPGTNEIFNFKQAIEGFTLSDIDIGSENAKPITVSFWVRSSLTGTFSVAFLCVGDTTLSQLNSSYVHNYTISSANTWEYKSFTVSPNTITIPNKTNGQAFQIRFPIGNDLSSTSRVTSTLDTWIGEGANFFGSTNDTQLISNAGATFYFTGVQLEVGSIATEFERRFYGTELALCQRYYQIFKHRIEDDAAGDGKIFFGGASFPTQMRTTPTATTSYTASNLVNTGEIHFRYRENYSFLQGIRETGSGTAYADITNTFSAEI